MDLSNVQHMMACKKTNAFFVPTGSKQPSVAEPSAPKYLRIVERLSEYSEEPPSIESTIEMKGAQTTSVEMRNIWTEQRQVQVS